MEEDEHGQYDAEGKWHPAGEPWPGDVSDLDEDEQRNAEYERYAYGTGIRL